jgi:hypothetical protein
MGTRHAELETRNLDHCVQQQAVPPELFIPHSAFRIPQFP